MRVMTLCAIAAIVGVIYVASHLAWQRDEPLTTIERLRNLQKVKVKP